MDLSSFDCPRYAVSVMIEATILTPQSRKVYLTQMKRKSKVAEKINY